MTEPAARISESGVFATRNLKMPALFAGICLASMSSLLLLTALFFATYDVRVLVAFRIYNPFSVTVVGSYIFIFLTANAALSLPASRPGALVTAPTAMLAAWAIVAGPLYGWLIKAGILFAIVVSLVLSGGTFLGVLLLPITGPLLGPTTTGCLTGLLVHCAARVIAGQPLWTRRARIEALLHCLGFVVGAYIVYLSVSGLDKELAQLRKAGGGFLEYVGLLWPVFLGAPASHLACLAFARYRGGWPEGTLRAKRLLILSLVLFGIIGTGRSLHWKDPALMLTWPAKDLREAQFWKNYPRKNAPLVIGGYQVTLDGNPYSRMEWNRELQQYDYFQIFVSADAWPFPDAKVGPLEVRLREAHAPYVAVVCNSPSDNGLLRCRPRGPNETSLPGDRSVPEFWIRYDYEIYGPPERPDIVLGRKYWTATKDYHLGLAYSASHSPNISVLLPIYRFDLAHWHDAVAEFDRVVGHHLHRSDRQ